MIIIITIMCPCPLLSWHKFQIWEDVRNQKPPQGFSHNFPLEVHHRSFFYLTHGTLFYSMKRFTLSSCPSKVSFREMSWATTRIFWYHGDHKSCCFFLQNHIIRSMLCVKPEDRPEASNLKLELEDCSCKLMMLKDLRRESKTVW